jgi:SAM-dependent methyltransferase
MGLPPLSVRASLRFDVVLRVVDRLQPASVLEIGCGVGAVGARLATRAAYVGVEPDARAAAVARSRIEARGGTVVVGTDRDVEAGRTFQLVAALEVLEHIKDDVAAVTSWTERIEPGGHLVVSVPADQERFGPMDERVGHYRRYDEEQLSDCLTAAGLVVTGTSRYGWPLSFALEGVRNRLDRWRRSDVLDRQPEELSAASGRTWQPAGAVAGEAIELATLPFRGLQRLRPSVGTGLVMVAARP